MSLYLNVKSCIFSSIFEPLSVSIIRKVIKFTESFSQKHKPIESLLYKKATELLKTFGL